MGRWTRVRGGRATLLPALGDDRVREGMDRNGRCRRTRCVNRRVGKRRPAHREAGQHATPDVARALADLARDGREGDPRLGPCTELAADEPDPSYVEEATYVASLLPDARVEVHDLFAEPGQAAELIRRFTGAEPSVVSMDSVLATVLFTDIVGSTEKQSSLEIATGRTSSGATTRSCERAWRVAWGRERHGGRRVLRDLRRTGASAARLRSPSTSGTWGLRSEPASIPASARSSRASARGSRSRSVGAWRRTPARRGAHHPDCEGPRRWEWPRFPGDRRV